jgi:hypothetical protein
MVQSCVPALRTTSVAIAISIEAPSTVLLCLGGFFDADNSRENSQHKQQEPHDRFPNVAQEADINARELAAHMSRQYTRGTRPASI